MKAIETLEQTQTIKGDEALSAEEAFLWHIARHWNSAESTLQFPTQLNWPRFVKLVAANKMGVLVTSYLRQHAWLSRLPADAAAALAEAETANRAKAETLTRVLCDYMQLADEANVPTIPLKGLWVSERIYHNPAVRPGHDLDLLTTSADTQACIDLCEQLGFDRFWPGLLPDDYYMRHHLHLELSLADCWTWIEIHWAFDHPRTLLTIDYDAILARTTRADLLGANIWEPNLVDVLLSLSVHLVKHAIYLPVVLEHPRLERLLMADKRLIHSLDIAELVKQHGDGLDWDLLLKVTEQSGAGLIMHSVLHMCRRLFDAPVPSWVLEALSAEKLPNWQTRLFEATAEHILAKAENRPQQHLWSWLLEPNWTLVFRPIRLLDYINYLAPTDDYLQRAYGNSRFPTRLRHGGQALFTYTRLVWDTVSATIQVRRHPLTPDIALPLDSKCRDCS